MRLREVAQILEKNYPRLTYTSVQVGDFIEITEFIDAMIAIEEMSNFPFLRDDIKKLINMPEIYNNRSSDNKVRVSTTQYRDFSDIMGKLISKCSTVLVAINGSVTEESDCSLNVKLPDYDDLAKIARFFQDLNSALTLSLGDPKIGGKIEVKAFETGSLWVTISVGTTVAVKLLTHIAHSALAVKKKYYEIEKTKLDLQAVGMNLEFQKHYLDAASSALDLLVKGHAANLVKSHEELNNSDHEYTARLEKSIQLIGKLFYEGTEIHKALNAPAETTSDNFPEYNKLETEAGIKELMEQKKLMPSIETSTTVPDEVKEDTPEDIKSTE